MIRSMPGCGQACRWKQEWTPGAARSQGRFDETIATVDVAARHACRLRAAPAPFPAGRHNHAIPRLEDRPEGRTCVVLGKSFSVRVSLCVLLFFLQKLISFFFFFY